MSLVFMDGFDDGLQRDGKYLAFHANNDLATSWGRNGIGVRIDSGVNDSIESSVPSNDTYVVGSAVWWNGTFNSGLNQFAFKEGTTVHIAVRLRGSDGAFELRRGTTLIETTAPGLFSIQHWHYIEIKVVVHDSTGSVVINVDGTEVHSLTGADTRNGGTGIIDRISHGTESGATAHMYLDDYYILNDLTAVNDDFLGDCVVETVNPDGNGNYSDHVGSDGNSTDNYLLVDDAPTPDDDTTYVEAGTALDKDSYTFAAVTADSGATVFGVQAGHYVRHTGGGGTMRALHRRSSTDAFGTTVTPASSFTFKGYLWNEDPQAGPGAWTVTNVDASEFGQEIVS